MTSNTCKYLIAGSVIVIICIMLFTTPMQDMVPCVNCNKEEKVVENKPIPAGSNTLTKEVKDTPTPKPTKKKEAKVTKPKETPPSTPQIDGYSGGDYASWN